MSTLEELEAEVQRRKRLWIDSYNELNVMNKAILAAEEKLRLFKVAAGVIANPPPKQEPINPFQSVPLQDRKILIAGLDMYRYTLEGNIESWRLITTMKPELMAIVEAQKQENEVELKQVKAITKSISDTMTGNPAQAKEELEDANPT